MAHQAKWAPFKRAAFAALLAAALFGLPFKAAAADDYPNRVVQLIVPFPPGGGVDTEGRVIAQKLSDALGQQVIVVNKPGAGSVIGVRDAAKAAPDGYTILMLVTGASLPANTGYDLAEGLHADRADRLDPDRDHGQPVGAGENHVGYRRARQEEAGHAHGRHAAGADAELFRRRGVQGHVRRRHDHRHLQGHRAAHHRSARRPRDGRHSTRCRRRSATSRPASSAPSRWPRRKRLAAIPDVPTTAESGMPGLDIVQYYGLVAPAGTPKPIIARLNKELRKIVMSEDVKQRIIADGGGPVASTPEEYAANIQREEGKWAALIKKLGLVVN